MTRILGKDSLEIKDSKSIVSFSTQGGGQWEKWHRFICIEGKTAYEIGNICGTCSFYFERLEGANQSIHPTDLIEQLNKGVVDLDREITEKISKIIPNGKYEVLLLKVHPKKTQLGTAQDYFANEEIKLWGVDTFWRMPHNPKITYYRGTDQLINQDEKLFEFIVPIFPEEWLDKNRVDFYKHQIEEGKIPTAICLSVLDIKAPAVWNDDQKPEYTGHWCLDHYILDGHHKISAATQLNKPINMICFLALEEGIYNAESDVDTLLQTI